MAGGLRVQSYQGAVDSLMSGVIWEPPRRLCHHLCQSFRTQTLFVIYGNLAKKCLDKLSHYISVSEELAPEEYFGEPFRCHVFRIGNNVPHNVTCFRRLRIPTYRAATII